MTISKPDLNQLLGVSPEVRSTVSVPINLSDGRTVDSSIFSFSGLRDGREHFAVKLGVPATDSPLVRLHSECVTGDVLGSARCDCGPQLNEGLHRLYEEGGYLLYLRQEGRGIGLYRKLEAYLLQDNAHDTFSANRALGRDDDERNYGVAADMLHALKIHRIRLLSNNPDKRDQLTGFGIKVDDQVRTGVFVNKHNRKYLEAKACQRLHTIDIPLPLKVFQ
jgi:GTP cyclohydrolase II